MIYNEDTFNERGPALVVYQTAEDGISDTIVPRLKKMQPNFNNIFCIDETEQGLTLTDERIEKILKEKRPRLFIIDPLQAYLGGDVDMHRANQVRPLLAKIGRLAEQYQCAFILIMHMSKMSGTKALYRGLGSIDFAAAARSVLVIASNPDDIDEKIMAHEKSSLAKHGESISFSIDHEKGIVINGTSELTADDILNPVKSGGNRGGSREDAMNLLAGLLSENGYALKGDIEREAQAAGISQRTLQRARQDMELKSILRGFGKDKKGYWILPTADKEDIPEPAVQTVLEYPGTWPPT
ncbi:MAG: AAA family ATPase [Oscillospiraceae bacterium]|nr:AAA family ATPase [Oscillospiraceae bacterium]